MMRTMCGGAALLALVIVSACLPASLTSLVRTDNTKLSDTIRTGVTTSEEAVEEHDLGPYGVRVQWIAWDSGFRGTDLRIGDRIIGVDDQLYERADRKIHSSRGVGGWAEPQHWADRKARDGTIVTLQVWRKGTILRVTGKLRAERFYFNTDKQRAMGPGGPWRLGNDGFSGSWSRWYDDQVRDAIHVLDGGWRRTGFSNRALLDKHREGKERVDYLVEHYPGPFASTILADWQWVHDALLGPERTVDDLEYRTLGSQRATEIKRIAEDAHRDFLARHTGATIEPFPTIDPIEGDMATVAGKIVVLPELGRRDWISEAGHGYLMAGDERRGFYFIDSRSESFKRVLVARYRYQELVSPMLDETYAIIGRIEAAPTLRVIGSRAVTGLSVEVLGVLVGGGMFVDAQVVERGESPFAGQKTLVAVGTVPVADDASPQQVMEAAITALKIGNEDAWEALLARWYLSIYSYGNERVYFNPAYYDRGPGRAWVDGRRLILDSVYDVRVVDVGLVHQLTSGIELAGGVPKVEEVAVEVEHIGKFPEGFRPFTRVSVTRVWQLQRVDGGPWRIVTREAI